MRNFILFIRRFFHLILFIGLEVLCIVLIARTNMMQGNDIMSSANSLLGLLYKKQNDVVYYFGLRRMNDSLLAENAALRLKLAAYNSVDTLADRDMQVAINAGDTVHVVKYADYRYKQARVINNSIAAANNYITINRGSDNGINKGMAVISGNGIVGRIVHVSGSYASALSVLSVKQQVSAKLKDGTIGHVVWEGDRPDVMLMKDVPQQIKIRKGDTVYTTSYSFFPPDIKIGVVYKTEMIKKSTQQLLYLKPTTNFRNLQYVYVVEDKMMPERMQLEDSVKNNK